MRWDASELQVGESALTAAAAPHAATAVTAVLQLDERRRSGQRPRLRTRLRSASAP